MTFKLADIVEVTVSQDIIDIASEKSETMGTLKNSLTEGAGNIYGFIGEGVVYRYLVDNKVSVNWNNSYDWDILIEEVEDSEGKSINKLDVKSSVTNVKPMPHYNCLVSAFNTQQNCDAYVFTRVTKDLTKCWLLGFMLKEDFYNQADFFEKGERDPNRLSFKFVNDTYGVLIRDLTPINELITKHINS